MKLYQVSFVVQLNDDTDPQVARNFANTFDSFSELQEGESLLDPNQIQVLQYFQ